LRKAFDPLVLHLTELALSRRGRATLSFGESLDGTRDILIVAARELTDLLAVVPAARALRKRFRLARVHVAASPPCAAALQNRSEVFSVVPAPDDSLPLLSRELFDLVRELRRHPFDLAVAVDDGADRRARVLAALSGARLRVGIHPEGKDPCLNLVVSAAVSGGYRPVQSLEFLSFLGIPREEIAPTWQIPDADRQYARRLLDLRRRGRQGWLLGVDPGAGKGNTRPNPEKLAWLVNRLVAGRGALPIILTDDPADPCVDQFKSSLKSPPLEVATRGIRDVLSFSTCCDVLLSGNTNLFHFAVALGVPTVGLVPPDEEARWVPDETARVRLLRWKPGERVAEQEFFATVDSVRRSRVVEMPIRVELEGDDAPSPGRGESVRAGDGEARSA
jgi:ADP-heptose:LPS heptosyltransferase